MTAKATKKENKPYGADTRCNDTRQKGVKDKYHLYLLLAGLLVCIYVFYPVLQADFVNWDDDVNIYENDAVLQFDVKEIFSTTVIGNYNPLTILTFAIEYKLFGCFFLAASLSYVMHYRTGKRVYIILLLFFSFCRCFQKYRRFRCRWHCCCTTTC
ncbi:MAG: hypothetical protein BWY70_01480 [Bacteroidetes bacterium ADurb.Bin408]|nr:MAG: hypothetical protein BWY70_01480 [Bacteroidetes bacterium ADurb.Bin408]